jgi:hypothetical protein
MKASAPIARSIGNIDNAQDRPAFAQGSGGASYAKAKRSRTHSEPQSASGAAREVEPQIETASGATDKVARQSAPISPK